MQLLRTRDPQGAQAHDDRAPSAAGRRHEAKDSFGLVFLCAALGLLTGLALFFSTRAEAGEADVVDVRIEAMGEGRYRIDTTVLHADAGWDHYANRWDVLAPDGTVLGSRVLAHPHDNEQPFTRSLTLQIPKGITEVTIRANDSVHELGGKEISVAVPASS